MFTFSVVVVDLPTDCILSFLFPAETDVLVPVFSQSTDVVVVNSVVVLKFPISITTTGSGCMTVTILIVDLAWSSLWVDKFYQFLSFLLLCEVRLGLMKKNRYGDVENFRPEIENTV